MSNNQVAVTIIICLSMLFLSQAIMEQSNTNKIVETCKEAK